MNKFANFMLFQIGWFACVLGGAYQLPWAGTAVALAIVAWHLYTARQPRVELGLIAAAAAIGLVFDSALVAAGWLAYPSGLLHPSLAPHWIIAMWMLFATTLNSSLGWLQRVPWLAVPLGAAAGPLAYLGGAALGGVKFVAYEPALIALAVGWSLWLPLLVALARRLVQHDLMWTLQGDARHV